jgi:hypothetical protein
MFPVAVRWWFMPPSVVTNGLALHLFHVDHAGDVDARVCHQVASQLEDKPAASEARVGPVGGQELPVALPEPLQVELLHLLEVRDAEAAAEVDHLERIPARSAVCSAISKMLRQCSSSASASKTWVAV